MLTPEVKKYKRRLRKNLKEAQDWLETHPKTPSQKELEGYDKPYQRTEVIVRRKKEYEQRKENKEDILAALGRIANGTYGICIDSPKDSPHKIEKGRLNANPAYKRCCSCQANHFATELK